MLKKKLCLLLACSILWVPCVSAEARPTPPDGQPPMMADGQQPPEPKDGQQPPMGIPGEPVGYETCPESYAALFEVTDSETLEGVGAVSEGTDENVYHINGGALILDDPVLSRVSKDSSGGDFASFYGVGAAVLATSGSCEINGGTITTECDGGAGAFAYGDGEITLNGTTIETYGSASGGLHVAGGGTLHAYDLLVHTRGASSAAIRSDRGGGTLSVEGGSYTADGSGSPAVYVTANLSLWDAELTATGSEALCLEGRNSVALYDCVLDGDMPDLEQNDNTWNVILYQSMSGDAEVGKGSFSMDGGTIIARNGGMFYTTNTDSEFSLRHVELVTEEEGAYLLRCTGNTNARGWGTVGSNGANCDFNVYDQTLNGDILWDSVSNLTLNLNEASTLTGAIVNDESCAGEGGDGGCVLNLGEGCSWIVTGDSTLTALNNNGIIRDPDGKSVSIYAADGTRLIEGDSEYSVTLLGKQ